MVVLYYDPHDSSLRYENLYKILQQTVKCLRAEGRNDKVMFLPRSLEVKEFTGEELLWLHEEVTNMLKIIEREIRIGE